MRLHPPTARLALMLAPLVAGCTDYSLAYPHPTLRPPPVGAPAAEDGEVRRFLPLDVGVHRRGLLIIDTRFASYLIEVGDDGDYPAGTPADERLAERVARGSPEHRRVTWLREVAAGRPDVEPGGVRFVVGTRPVVVAVVEPEADDPWDRPGAVYLVDPVTSRRPTRTLIVFPDTLVRLRRPVPVREAVRMAARGRFHEEVLVESVTPLSQPAAPPAPRPPDATSASPGGSG